MTRPTIHLREFFEEDPECVALRPESAAELALLGWDWKSPPGPTWTLVRYPWPTPDDRVVGFGGFVRQAAPGHFQGFCFLASIPRGDWQMLLRCAEAAIRQMKLQHGATLITALVRADFAGAIAVLERLKFLRSAEASEWPGYRVMAREL